LLRTIACAENTDAYAHINVHDVHKLADAIITFTPHLQTHTALHMQLIDVSSLINACTLATNIPHTGLIHTLLNSLVVTHTLCYYTLRNVKMTYPQTGVEGVLMFTYIQSRVCEIQVQKESGYVNTQKHENHALMYLYKYLLSKYDSLCTRKTHFHTWNLNILSKIDTLTELHDDVSYKLHKHSRTQ
jgi:hypothetical protein